MSSFGSLPSEGPCTTTATTVAETKILVLCLERVVYKLAVSLICTAVALWVLWEHDEGSIHTFSFSGEKGKEKYKEIRLL